MVSYQASRLLFKADVIEGISNDSAFAILTPKGTFRMTKAEFYQYFDNVVNSDSYRLKRIYSYSTTPKKAMRFFEANDTEVDRDNQILPRKDLVGDSIRRNIQQIGWLWAQSPNNPAINTDILKQWSILIQDWKNDPTMPLIVRKHTSQRGQELTHSTGRKIIVADNSFAVWVFHCVLNELCFTLPQIRGLLEIDAIPIALALHSETKQLAKYRKTLGNNVLKDWKLCHIKPVGLNTRTAIADLAIKKLEEHFIRYANPMNMFILPKEIGGLGEIQEFIDEQYNHAHLIL